MNITVIIPAFNEEKALPLLKKKLDGLRNIILIDNFSNDNTYELSRSFGWTTYRFKNKGFSEDPDLIKFYLSKVSTEWIYICRADEIPSDNLLKILKSNEIHDFHAIRVIRRNFLNGKRCYTWGLDYETPIFQKEYFIPSSDLFRLGYPGTFKKNTKIKVFSKKSSVFISHFIDYTPQGFFNAINKYSTLWSDYLLNNSKSNNYAYEESIFKNIIRNMRLKIYRNTFLNLIALFLMPFLRFLLHFFIKGGYKSGLDGFISSMYMACEEIMISLKCLTANNGWPKN
tara:strand:+ start:27691 stop:28545 length:855 start_codon:yes stop_codon:yes gene_type:complete